MKKYILHLFLCVNCLGSGVVYSAENLLANGGFETDMQSWSWHTNSQIDAAWAMDTRIKFEGTKSLKMWNKAPSLNARGWIEQNIQGLMPGTEYRISLKFKGERIGSCWIGGRVEGKPLERFPVGDVSEWQDLSVKVQTPVNETFYRLMIAMDGPTQSLWIDDIRVENVGGKLSTELKTPIIWHQDWMLNLKPDARPENLNDSLKVLSEMACINEFVPMVFNITNLSLNPVMEMRVVLTPFRLGSSTQMIPDDQVVVREAVFVRSREDRQLYADALTKLDQAGRVVVPYGQTRQVWVDVHTKGLKAGTYSAILKLVPIDPLAGQAEKEVNLSLEVLPAEFPENRPIHVTSWDYNLFRKPECLADLKAMGINTFLVIPPKGLAELKSEDAFRKALAGDVELAKANHAMLLIETADAWHRPLDWKWTPEVEQAYRSVIGYLKNQLPYAQFAVYPADEMLSDDFLEVARQIKRVDPKVNIFCTPTLINEKCRDINTYKNFSDAVGIWCLYLDIFKQRPDIIEYLKSTGKQVWTYDCGSTKARYVSAYRGLGWYCWKFDLQGYGFHTYGFEGQSTWNDFDGGSLDLSTVYFDKDNNPLPSRRWAGWREGVEDYLLLSTMEKSIMDAESQKKVSSNKAKALKEAMNHAFTEIQQSPDLSGYNRQRSKLLRSLKEVLKK